MTAAAYVFPPVLSKPVAEHSAPEAEHSAHDPHDCVFSAEGTGAEAPLTSEPPLPDAEPLTSEPPLADATPLTSESGHLLRPLGRRGTRLLPGPVPPGALA
ncbi:Secreted protein OS=Streptomyces tendae OX=1932 GN=F3L20_26685 PE=4 SV=1 [Streptomyces tendae]